MCAISLNGVIGFAVVDRAYNGDLFINFIVEKLIPYFAINRDSILILDNARFFTDKMFVMLKSKQYFLRVFTRL